MQGKVRVVETFMSILAQWCAWQDLNLHAVLTWEPKSHAYANFATDAYKNVVLWNTETVVLEVNGRNRTCFCHICLWRQIARLSSGVLPITLTLTFRHLSQEVTNGCSDVASGWLFGLPFGFLLTPFWFLRFYRDLFKTNRMATDKQNTNSFQIQQFLLCF